ncbi:MAG: metallophosphoesterase [Oscillospiraceae bacterium]|nr:metallophosphoesterase [Oscillospiraceae bacterium]
MKTRIGKIKLTLIKKRKQVYFFTGLLVLGSIACCNALTVKEYRLKTDKLSTGSEIRIILLTDLHNTLYGKEQKKLIHIIKAQNADLILLGGDMYRNASHGECTATRSLLEQIIKIAPVYSVMGNHEHWSGYADDIRNELNSLGIPVLENAYRQAVVNGNNLIIAGTEDTGFTPSVKTAFADLKTNDSYQILLTHYPENIESYIGYPFDLALSGHAHGGQVRIPFILNGLYSPGEGLFPKYAGGLYEHGGLTHIVSRGLSKTHPRLPRIFNRPEVVLIVIEGHKS